MEVESEVELGSESGTCEEGREMRNVSESTVEVGSRSIKYSPVEAAVKNEVETGREVEAESGKWQMERENVGAEERSDSKKFRWAAETKVKVEGLKWKWKVGRGSGKWKIKIGRRRREWK